MDPRISIITLGVEDLERSISFYRDGLGLPQREGPSGIAFFTTSGTWLSLYPRKKLADDARVDDAGSGFRGFTLAHNVKTRVEVDLLIERAENAGAQILKRPQDVEWGGYSGYFQDPDGFLWEVAWNPHFTVE
jgi:catechol 2,3-dioxygenase-like lactoylglutathione lyase family enzyme